MKEKKYLNNFENICSSKNDSEELMSNYTAINVERKSITTINVESKQQLM